MALPTPHPFSTARDLPVDLYSFAPIAAVLDAAYTVVIALSELIAPFAGASAAALAVVLITLVVRAALIPVGIAQIRAQLTRERLAPRLRQLQQKYKGKPELLQRKTMEFYAAEKASPLAGCLPTLAQAPVISIVYALFILPMINGHPNALLTQEFAGVPLGTSLVGLVGSGDPGLGAVTFVVMLAVLGVVAWMSRRVAQRLAPPVADAPPPAPGMPDMRRLGATLSWMPFIIVVIAAIVPLAATIYLTVTTSWTLAERILIRRALTSRARGTGETGLVAR